MTMREVINNGLILSRKEHYTISDFKALLKAGHSVSAARFICICSAIHHGTTWAESLNSLERLKYAFER